MSSETPSDDVLKAMKGVMRRLDQKNIERINKMESLKARNRKVGFGITGIVIGIYVYSMWAVKQETVLDELDRIEQKVKQ